MDCMVLMACVTTWPPREAASDATCAWVFACAAASVDCATDAVICSTALAVSRRLEAACSVRPEISWFPAAISCAASCTEWVESRSFTITTASLSLKALKAWAICATSSLPLSGRRWERSLVPLLMAFIASRITTRRLSSAATIHCISAPAIITSTISDTAEAFNCARRPAVASSPSRATTSNQSVPFTRLANSDFSSPAYSPVTVFPLLRSAKETP